MIVRARSPLRISFGGGGTDVNPYCEEHGGVVLNATIDKNAFCNIVPNNKEEFTIHSLDYNCVNKLKIKDTLSYDGNLDLVKVVINHFNVKEGFDMLLHCDSPPGSGLGSSSTVIVSIIRAVSRFLNQPMSHYEIADLAYKLERIELGIDGGKQDQYATTFGGFNFMEFGKDVLVNSLRLSRDVIEELEYRLLLIHTQKSRKSGDNIIVNQKKVYNDGHTKPYYDRAKDLTMSMKRALLHGHLTQFGEIMSEQWNNKKNFSSKISNPYIDKLYSTAISNGAIGGKLSGAGGGGYMFFLCDFQKKHVIANELEKLGAKIVPFHFAENGCQTWVVE